jgi:hypothetical protein
MGNCRASEGERRDEREKGPCDPQHGIFRRKKPSSE